MIAPLSVAGARRLHPAVRAYRMDARAIEGVPLARLAADLVAIRRVTPRFGEDLGPERLAALDHLARGWSGPRAPLLKAAADVLGLQIVAAEDDLLRGRLPELALALPSRETVLLLGSGDAAERDALERRIADLALRVPALVLTRGGEALRLLDAVVLREPDLRAIA